MDFVHVLRENWDDSPETHTENPDFQIQENEAQERYSRTLPFSKILLNLHAMFPAYKKGIYFAKMTLKLLIRYAPGNEVNIRTTVTYILFCFDNYLSLNRFL